MSLCQTQWQHHTSKPLLDSLNSELTLAYLDNLTFGDNQTKVAADVLRIKELSESIGLSLNISKCELVCNPSTDIVDPLLQSFTRRNVDDASLLGAPHSPRCLRAHSWIARSRQDWLNLKELLIV